MPFRKFLRGFAVTVLAAGVVGSFGVGLAQEAENVATTVPTSQPVGRDWSDISTLLERSGVEREGVYTVTIPRDDVLLILDGDVIPAGAGVASVFHFYVCPCGPDKIKVMGQFVVVEYEANDVIDELRKAHIEIASVGAMLVGEHPKLSVIRFQGEGNPVELGKGLREALKWMGEERMRAGKLKSE